MNPITSLNTEKLQLLMYRHLPEMAKDIDLASMSKYQLLIYSEYCRRNMLQNPSSLTYPAAMQHEILPVLLDWIYDSLADIQKLGIEEEIKRMDAVAWKHGRAQQALLAYYVMRRDPTLDEELQEFEKKHGMTTSEMLEAFKRGDVGDTPEIAEWLMLARLKRALRDPVPDQTGCRPLKGR